MKLEGQFHLYYFIINNFDLLLFSVVFVIILRSILSEIVVGAIIYRNGTKDYIVEIVMTIIFIIAARYFGLLVGFIIYLCAFSAFALIYRKDIIFLLDIVKKLICNKFRK